MRVVLFNPMYTVQVGTAHMRNPPSTASIHDYWEPVTRTRSLILDLAERANSGESKNLLDRTGWYVLAFASFETMIADLMIFHLLENPHLLPHEDRKIQTKQIISFNNGFKLIQFCVEEYVRSIGYKSIEEILKSFGEKLTIGQIGSQVQLERLSRAKDIRNKILHVDIHRLRKPHLASEGFIILIEICDSILEKVKERFGSLTRISVIEGLWGYMFPTPIMRPFDAFFHLDTEKDEVTGYKPFDVAKSAISNSERIYYEIWLSHFAGNVPIHGFNIRSLSDDKLFWFLSKLQRTALWGPRYSDGS